MQYRPWHRWRWGLCHLQKRWFSIFTFIITVSIQIHRGGSIHTDSKSRDYDHPNRLSKLVWEWDALLKIDEFLTSIEILYQRSAQAQHHSGRNHLVRGSVQRGSCSAAIQATVTRGCISTGKNEWPANQEVPPQPKPNASVVGARAPFALPTQSRQAQQTHPQSSIPPTEEVCFLPSKGRYKIAVVAPWCSKHTVASTNNDWIVSARSSFFASRKGAKLKSHFLDRIPPYEWVIASLRKRNPITLDLHAGEKFQGTHRSVCWPWAHQMGFDCCITWNRALRKFPQALLESFTFANLICALHH